MMVMQSVYHSSSEGTVTCKSVIQIEILDSLNIKKRLVSLQLQGFGPYIFSTANNLCS